ncbi:hypothetical protein AJ88_37445 [Mesorhizobium amorphae CCBAU 01583]|nr:hypothetical protein AJ88_37445 [Mesorhizobium amorphae CCBAU 01583]
MFASPLIGLAICSTYLRPFRRDQLSRDSSQNEIVITDMERLRSWVKSQFKAQEVCQLKTGVSPIRWLLAFDSACLLCHNFVGLLADFLIGVV